MTSIFCFFQWFFLRYSDKKLYGVPVINKKKSGQLVNITWIEKMKDISVNLSVNSDIFATNIIPYVEVIIKIPREPYGDFVENYYIIREYYIGTIINNLRFLVPNYAFTIGSFFYRPSKKLIKKKDNSKNIPYIMIYSIMTNSHLMISYVFLFKY